MKSFKQYLQLVQEEKVGVVDLQTPANVYRVVFNLIDNFGKGQEVTTQVLRFAISRDATIKELSQKLRSKLKEKDPEKQITISISKGYKETATLKEIFKDNLPEFSVEKTENGYFVKLIVSTENKKADTKVKQFFNLLFSK